MTLVAGTRLGSYEILAPIGSGGMGDVYRARDSKLDRDVALKLLPEALWQDSERRSRLEREARLLAALNHPAIAAIYGLEEHEGVRFLVLELIPGETLAQKFARGPLEWKEALSLFHQIAEALEAAHQKGIIHRDLKPDNVKLTPEGRIKVLDFGLAKDVSEKPPGEALSHSPTRIRGTETGVIMGTAAYMSPEQARGIAVDSRTDVWAFGCCLYEALTGRKAFTGETASDILARILEREPDWEKLPAGTPASVRAFLRRCLQKDPSRRLRDMWDVRVEIEEALAEPSPKPSVSPARISRHALAAAALLGALMTGMVFWSFRRPSSSGEFLTRFAIELPAGERLRIISGPASMPGPMAFSPDGRKLAYVATDGVSSRLYLRHLDRLEASAVPGTEDALDPFFSPDSEWLGFTANGRLHKLSLTSGERTTLFPQTTSRPSGTSWGDAGGILFSSEALERLPAVGGTPLEVLRKEGVFYRFPHFLPGGEEALLTVATGEGSHIGVLSLASGELKMLEGLGEATTAAYVATGHVVYGSRGRLMAAPFDLEKRKVLGNPVPVADDVYTIPGGCTFFSVSRSGALAYVPRGTLDPTLVLVDRAGRSAPSGFAQPFVQHPRFSPLGRLLAIDVGFGPADIWTFDLARGTRTRLTTDGENQRSTWSPDETRIAFGSGSRIVWRAADGSGGTTVVAERESIPFVDSWSPDGSLLAFEETNPATGWDIWVVPVEGDHKPSPFLATSFNETDGTFSPDGRFMAYTSDESGRFEVYVRAYPGPGGKVTVSTEGGSEARWSLVGTELFYRRGYQVLSVPVSTRPTFTAGKPRVLFEGDYSLAPTGHAHYDVSPDGKTFAMVETIAKTRIDVVLNWGEELKRLAPASRR